MGFVAICRVDIRSSCRQQGFSPIDWYFFSSFFSDLYIHDIYSEYMKLM